MTGHAQAMPIALLSWKPLQRNSLRGFASVRIGRSMQVNDVAVHCSHARKWAALPSKPMIDRDGNAIKDGIKIKYVPLLQWTDKDSADRFSEAVVAAIEAQYPGATDGDYAP